VEVRERLNKNNKNRVNELIRFICGIIGSVLILNTGPGLAATAEAVPPAAPVCDAKAAARVMGAAYQWSGDCQDGLPEGHGVAMFAEGWLFVGDMAAGLFEGYGTMTLPGGERYTGNFAAGRYQGRGVYTFANSDRYVGEFKDGLMNGTGVYRPAGSDERYRVEYVNGERVSFEAEVQAASILHEPALSGVHPELLRRVAMVDHYIRLTLGLSLEYTSGYRDEAKNAAVGGVLYSLHIAGRAVDLVVPGITPPQEELVAEFARQQGLWALWHGEGDNHHLHLQWNRE
jgi:hypothetical protein